MRKIAAWIGACRRQLVYLAVGGLTTLVNLGLFLLVSGGLRFHYLAANVFAWVGAVSFAYWANARWVYRTETGLSWGEAAAFFLSRLFSLGLESLFLWVGIDLLGAAEHWTKAAAAALVVIVNYFTGLLVFCRKKGA